MIRPTERQPGQPDHGPCRICHGAARHLSTKLCDRCWELEHRILGDRELAAQILTAVVTPPAEERLAIQHRTTKAYLTESNTTTMSLREADTFATREGARVIHEALEDFATAWDIVPAVGVDWPEEFPGAWQHWPLALRQVTMRLLLERHVHEFGAADLVKHIVTHFDPNTTVPFGARAEKFWPSFLAIARGADLLHTRPAPSPEPSPT